MPLFFADGASYSGAMSIIPGLAARARGLFSDNKGPWGPSGGDGDGGGSEPPPGGPWSEPPRKRRPGDFADQGAASLDDFFRRGRARFGGGLPGGGPSRSMIMWAVIGVILLWLIFTSIHSVAPGQRGVVTRFGRYSSTLGPGVSLTLPSPIDRVTKLDVENVRSVDLGSEGGTDR